MAVQVPTQVERDANLQALEQAVAEWAKKEQDRLDNESKFMRAVLQGRGASNVALQNLQAVVTPLQVEINQFVTFGK